MSRATGYAARVDDGLDGAHAGTSPTWVRDDPTGRQHVPHLPQAAFPHRRSQFVRTRKPPDRIREVVVGGGVAGQAPQPGHDVVEPQLEERRQGWPGGAGDLEHDDATPGSHDSDHLAQSGRRSEKLRAPNPTVAASNSSSAYGSARALAVSKRSSTSTGDAPAPVQTPSPEPARASPRRSRADDDPARRHAPRELQREVARPGGHVEHARARPYAGQIDRPPAPLVVQPGRHDAVHQVIDAGDPVEHRPHLGSGRVPGGVPRLGGHRPWPRPAGPTGVRTGS